MFIAVFAIVAERVRTLSFRGALDAAAFRRTLVELARRAPSEALALARGAAPALVARPVELLLDPSVPEGERGVVVAEAMMDLEQLAVRGMRPLRIGASVGSALGFLGAAGEIWWVFHGSHGLAALQAGRVESEGLGRAVLSIALGVGTSSFALGSWSVLKDVARERLAEARRVVDGLEEALHVGSQRTDSGFTPIEPGC